MEQAFPSYNEYKEYLLKHSVSTLRSSRVQSSFFAWPVVIWGIFLLFCAGIVVAQTDFDPSWNWMGMDGIALLGILFAILILPFVGGAIIIGLIAQTTLPFLLTPNDTTVQQHNHNLKALARLLNLTLDEHPGCDIKILTQAMYPYWFRNYKAEILGSLYGNIQNRIGEIVLLQKNETLQVNTRRILNGSIKQNRTDQFFVGYGLVAVFPLKTHFTSSTILCHDKATVLHKYIEGWQKATLESVDFEKEFDVFTTNQIEARQLLTPDTMEAIIQSFKNVSLSEFVISFSHNCLFVMVPHADEWTSPGFYEKLAFLFQIPTLFNFKNFPYEWDTDTLYRQRFQQDKQNDE